MSLLTNWINEKVRIFHKVLALPTTESAVGIYFVKNNTRRGVYLVSGKTGSKVVHKILDSYDWYTKAEVDAKVDTLTEQLGLATSGLIYQNPVETVNDLTTTYPTPLLGWASMVTDEGFVYAWNGTAWVNTGLKDISLVIKNESSERIYEDKKRVSISSGVNLFNRDNVEAGYLNQWGTVSEQQYFYHTEFIACLAGDVIVTNKDAGNTPRIHVYDINKQYLSSVLSTDRSVTIPTTGAFVRFTFYSEDGSFGDTMICKDALPIEYVPFNPIYGYMGFDKKLVDNKIDIKLGVNLFNPDNVEAGYLNQWGTVSEQPYFYHTEFIACLAGDVIVTNKDAGSTPRIHVYNINKQYLSSVLSTDRTVTIPTTGAFVRFTFYSENGSFGDTMICKDALPIEYVPFNPIGGYIEKNSYDRKKILWIGTSIPAYSSYPQVACTKLGYECINKAIGSSGLVVNTGVLGNDRDGKDLCETISEKISRYTGHVTPEKLELYKSYSFENIVIPYLSGDNKVDMILIDHGFNDRDKINSEIATLSSANFEISDSVDRSTFLGAFRYLLAKIYAINPYVKIVIGGYLEATSNISVRGGLPIKIMHEKLSEQYGFPLLRVFDHTGFNFKHVPNSSNFMIEYNTANNQNYENVWPDENGNVTLFQMHMPDSVHPHSDTTGKTNERLNSIYTKLLRDIM